MKIEPGKLYRTRDDSKARIYAIACGGNYPIHGAVWDEEENWIFATWTNEGRFFAKEHNLDLVAEWREPVKLELWEGEGPTGS